MTSKDELSAAVRDLHRRPFPPHAEDDRLTDWMIDLLAADSYYAGVASTLSSRGRHAVRLDGSDLAELRRRLPQLQPLVGHDRVVARAGDDYLAALERLCTAAARVQRSP